MDYTAFAYEDVFMIRFENPNYLLLLLLVFPAFIMVFVNITKLKASYGNAPYAKKMIRRIRLRSVFFSFAWCLLVLSLACPLWGAKPVSVRRRGVSVMIVSDVSRSMTVTDMGSSRLAVQKQFLKMFLEKLDKAACGLVITKGDGILSIPLSFEKQAVFSAIDSLSPHVLTSAGTDLEAGVLKALDSFSGNRGNSKIVILCTDGGENSGSLLRACETIKKSDAILIIAGFGTAHGGNVSVYDEQGESQLKETKLEEEFLIRAAKIAGENSLYVSASSPGAVLEIIKAVNSGVEVSEKMVYIQEPVKRNFEMALAAFILICLGGLPFYGKNK